MVEYGLASGGSVSLSGLRWLGTAVELKDALDLLRTAAYKTFMPGDERSRLPQPSHPPLQTAAGPAS